MSEKCAIWLTPSFAIWTLAIFVHLAFTSCSSTSSHAKSSTSSSSRCS
jgi:hypothetical protein